MTDDDVVSRALSIMEMRVRGTDAFQSSKDVRAYLQIKMGEYEREVFAVLFLNTRHRMLELEELFLGTIDKAVVYPREIAKRALQLNAAAVILVHNHPSGVAEPSSSDHGITAAIQEAMKLFDIRVLDHIVVCAGSTVSFAERGLL